MKIYRHNSFWILIATKAIHKVTGFKFLFTLPVFMKKCETINYDRTIGTNKIKLLKKKITRNTGSTLRNV